MTKSGGNGEFKEIQKVHVLQTRKGEELHFAVVELGGHPKVDIRYFSKTEEGLRPTHRGIVVDIAKLDDLMEGAQKLVSVIGK